MARTFNTTFHFNANGLGSLIRARNIVKSLGGTSWSSFNQMSRAASSAQREFAKLAGGFGAGLGVTYFTKSMISANAELQTNRLIFENMVDDSKEANEMIAMLQENAAKYGYDLGEVMKSARGLYSGFSAGGRKVDTSDLENLLKMAETLNALDTENRGISFAAFSLKEIAQGMGKMDFKSMTNRMEIPFREATQQAITKALQSGDTKKALELLWKGLEEAKVPRNLLDKMAKEGFLQNVNRFKSYVGRIFLGIGEPLFNELAKSLSKLNEVIAPLFKPGSEFMASMSLLGKNMADNIKSFVAPAFDGMLKFIFSNEGMQFFDNIQYAFKNIGEIAKEAATVVIAFLKGLNLMDENSAAGFRDVMVIMFDNIKQWMPHIQAFAFHVGKLVRYVIDLALKHPEITGFAAALTGIAAVFNLMGGTAVVSGILGLARALGILRNGVTLLGGAVGGGAVAGGASAGVLGTIIMFLTKLQQPVNVGGIIGGLSKIITKLHIIKDALAVIIKNPMWLRLTGIGAVGAAAISFAGSDAAQHTVYDPIARHLQGAPRYDAMIGANKPMPKLSDRTFMALYRQAKGEKLNDQDIAIIANLNKNKKLGDHIRTQFNNALAGMVVELEKQKRAVKNVFPIISKEEIDMYKRMSPSEKIAMLPNLPDQYAAHNYKTVIAEEIQKRIDAGRGRGIAEFNAALERMSDNQIKPASKETKVNFNGGIHVTVHAGSTNDPDKLGKKSAEVILREMQRTGGLQYEP